MFKNLLKTVVFTTAAVAAGTKIVKDVLKASEEDKNVIDLDAVQAVKVEEPVAVEPQSSEE